MTRRRRRTGSVLVTLLIAVGVTVVSWPVTAGAGGAAVSLSAAPRSVKERDPAASAQTGLDVAMGRPTTTVVTPGAVVRVGRGKNVVDTGRTREKPVRTESVGKLKVSPRSAFGDIFTSPTAAGGGCRLDYGSLGQCLPRVPPSQALHASHGMATSEVWSCAEVRTLFADGLAVRRTGNDPLGLDGNRDGTACGPGD